MHWQIKNPGDRKTVFNKTGGRCWYCNVKLTKTGRNAATDFCVDHYIPRGRPGSSGEMSNLVPSCMSCNASKGSMTPERFFLYLKKVGRFSARLFASMGGRATVKKRGKDHMRSLGLAGSKARWGGKD